MAKKIPLSDVLGNITEELIKADSKAEERGFAAMKNFTECEIEFAIEAEKEVGGGVRVWVLELGGKAKRSNVNTIRIKFTANPRHTLAEPARTSESAPKPSRQTPKTE